MDLLDELVAGIERANLLDTLYQAVILTPIIGAVMEEKIELTHPVRDRTGAVHFHEGLRLIRQLPENIGRKIWLARFDAGGEIILFADDFVLCRN